MVDLLIKNGIIVTMNPDRKIINDGAVAIEKDRVADVGSSKELEEKYNPETVKNLMCRHLISVAPDGTLYDCDFWQMLKLPVKNRNSNTVNSFDYTSLSSREIVTAPLCFMCTAGAGASCGGALV